MQEEQITKELPDLQEDSSESNTKDLERNGKLQLRLQEVESEYLKYLSEWWELKRWNDYLYKTKEMDCFELPVVNAFLSEWDDDDSYDVSSIFGNCRICLKIAEELKFAISVCETAAKRQLELWKEGIKNIQDIISRKLDYMSFMLLKDAEKYLDPKSGNMEYGVTDGEEDESVITLCLWANLYMAVRKQGMSILGFSFRLPMDIILEDCAVRLMHTFFDHVSPETHITEEVLPEEKEILKTEIFGAEEISEHEGDRTETIDDEVEVVELEVDTDTGKDNGYLNESGKKPTPEENYMNVKNEYEQLEASLNVPEEETQVEVDKKLSSKEFSVFDPKNLPPLVEPEVQIVDPDEYFVVGGVFHFNLCLVPQLTVRSGRFTYIHRETPKLRKIRYKRRIVPPRTLDGDTSYTASAYEKLRYRKELENAIFVQLKLPKKVMFLNIPEPARLFLEKGGYSKDCIYESSFNKDTRQISFKTNQFGIFAMLQKKHENFPYKKWELKGGESVVLTLIGKVLEIEIQISHAGYAVTFLHPDDEFILQDVNNVWMAADLLVEKLRSVGINIEHGSNASNFVNICEKETAFEDEVYDCMSLLSSHCTFKSVRESSNQKDLIYLEFTIIEKGNPQTVVIRKDEVVDLEVERKRIEVAEKAAAEEKELREKEGMSEDLETEKKMTVEGNAENQATGETTAEEEKKMPSQEVFEEPIFRNLYDCLMNDMNEKQKAEVMSTNVCAIENVRRLLKICRPISSM